LQASVSLIPSDHQQTVGLPRNDYILAAPRYFRKTALSKGDVRDTEMGQKQKTRHQAG
jgi:hypothetical protein